MAEADRKEIFRYLGYKNTEPDEGMKELTEAVLKETVKAADFKYLYRQYPLELSEEEKVDAVCFRTKSRNLSKNLGGCEEILILAATLGAGCDRLIQKYTRLSMTRAVIAQAAAAALLEAECDELCTRLSEEYEKKGWFFRPRFSPGYGDFSLDCQESLLEALGAGKQIGIRLTDSCLMMPSKSITAVMGMSREPYKCQVKGCEACGKTDCEYRRNSS